MRTIVGLVQGTVVGNCPLCSLICNSSSHQMKGDGCMCKGPTWCISHAVVIVVKNRPNLLLVSNITACWPVIWSQDGLAWPCANVKKAQEFHRLVLERPGFLPWKIWAKSLPENSIFICSYRYIGDMLRRTFSKWDNGYVKEGLEDWEDWLWDLYLCPFSSNYNNIFK